jgi:hypothetical protein
MRIRKERIEMASTKGSGGLTVSPDGREVDVALGAAPAGRLVFANGAAQLRLAVGAGLDRLVRARFDGTAPKAVLEGETLTFRYPRMGLPPDWRRRRAEVTLSASVPWEIQVKGGAATVDADLRGLRLLSLRIGAGASGVEVRLPPPEGAVPVTIGGGASHVSLSRPAEVPVSLRIRGGASHLSFGEESFGAIGGPVNLQSDHFREQTDRYEISVGGGASRLTIAESG